MQTATVSEQGQVIIPLDIRKQLDITPGCQLSFTVEGSNLRVEVNRRIQPTKSEDGFGLLVCKLAGERNLAEFDVAQAMRDDYIQKQQKKQKLMRIAQECASLPTLDHHSFEQILDYE